MMKKTLVSLLATLFVLSIGFLASPCALAGDFEDIFKEAGTLYEKGEYAAAIALYEQILDRGFESGNLYFNIGNCYFKQDDLGRALLYYARSRRLMPRDGDLLANYTYARSLVKKPDMQHAEFWLIRVLRFFTHSFTVDELTLCASIIFALLLIASGCLLLGHCSKRLYYIFVTVFVLIVCVVSFGIVDGARSIGRDAIIVAKETDARFGPFERATVHFTVYEGMRVAVQERKGIWYKIERPDGNSGWVPREALEII
jgi:hypothetical protein